MDLSETAKQIFRTVAPVAAGFFGTPLAGMAVKSVLDKWLGPDESGKPLDAKAIEKALIAMTPEQALELKKADQEFATRMAELGIEADKLQIESERVAAEDRASARQREVATGDHTPRIMAWVILAGFFGVIAAQFYLVISGLPLPDDAMRSLDITTGVLFALVVAVKDYHLGSTSGSARKTEVMSNAIQGGRGHGK